MTLLKCLTPVPRERNSLGVIIDAIQKKIFSRSND